MKRQLGLVGMHIVEWAPYVLLCVTVVFADSFYSNNAGLLTARLLLNALLLWTLYRAVMTRRYSLACLTLAIAVGYDVMVPSLMRGAFFSVRYDWFRSWAAFTYVVLSFILFARFSLRMFELKRSKSISTVA